MFALSNSIVDLDKKGMILYGYIFNYVQDKKN